MSFSTTAFNKAARRSMSGASAKGSRTNYGRYVALRQPQPADLPVGALLPDSRNLGLILNQLEHSDAGPKFNRLLTRFLPRYQRLSTLIQGGTVQFYLHEQGLK